MRYRILSPIGPVASKRTVKSLLLLLLLLCLSCLLLSDSSPVLSLFYLSCRTGSSSHFPAFQQLRGSHSFSTLASHFVNQHLKSILQAQRPKRPVLPFVNFLGQGIRRVAPKELHLCALNLEAGGGRWGE